MAFALVEYEGFQSLAKEGHVTKDQRLYLNVHDPELIHMILPRTVEGLVEAMLQRIQTS